MKQQCNRTCHYVHRLTDTPPKEVEKGYNFPNGTYYGNLGSIMRVIFEFWKLAIRNEDTVHSRVKHCNLNIPLKIVPIIGNERVRFRFRYRFLKNSFESFKSHLFRADSFFFNLTFLYHVLYLNVASKIKLYLFYTYFLYLSMLLIVTYLKKKKILNF